MAEETPPPVTAPIDLTAVSEEEDLEGYDEKETKELFYKFAEGKKGSITPEQFRTAMRELSPGVDDKQLEEGLVELDADGDGEISYEGAHAASEASDLPQLVLDPLAATSHPRPGFLV